MLVDAEIKSADPRFTISSHDSKLSRLVAAGLTAVDTPTLEPRLELASKIEYIDPVTVDITVRDDARFSDGRPVTAHDVFFTYNSVLEPQSKSLHHKGFVERFVRFEVRSEKTIRFHLKQKIAMLMSDLDFGIISPSGLGAGPYVLKSLTPERVDLETNPYYFGAKPKLPRLVMKIVRDPGARLLMLVGGSADLLQNSVRLDVVEDILEQPRVKLVTGPSVILTYLMLNNADPLLSDLRVRQAIALALDRQAIVAGKFGGRAQLASSLLPKQHWAFTADVPTWNRDLARAKRLLDEAGLRDPDGDGPAMRLGRDGRPLELSYKTSADAFRISVARVIAAQLAEVGLAVDVKSFEFGTFFADVKRGSYQLASMQTAELNDPDYYFFYFHSERIPSTKNPDGGNRWRYASAEMDHLALAGRSVMDRAQRKAIYADAARVLARDLPIVPLWHEDNVVLTNVDVQGYAITPNARLIGLRDAWKQ